MLTDDRSIPIFCHPSIGVRGYYHYYYHSIITMFIMFFLFKDIFKLRVNPATEILRESIRTVLCCMR